MIAKNTKNISFKNFQYKLQDNDVKNCFFMNETIDEKLVDVDVYDTLDSLRNKSAEKGLFIDRVKRECARNIWYYFREIVRIPDVFHTRINDDTNLARYPLTERCAKMIYLYDCGCSSLLMQSEYYDLEYLTIILIALREEFFKPDNTNSAFLEFFNKVEDTVQPRLMASSIDAFKPDINLRTIQQCIWAMNSVIGTINALYPEDNAVSKCKILSKPTIHDFQDNDNPYFSPNINDDESLQIFLDNSHNRYRRKCIGRLTNSYKFASFDIVAKYLTSNIFYHDYRLFYSNKDDITPDHIYKI